MPRPKGTHTAIESYMLINGKIGDVFYTDKLDKSITALSCYYKRAILTERLITITTGGKTPIAKYITKVTLKEKNAI